jgi:serine/threonine-protein kinase
LTQFTQRDSLAPAGLTHGRAEAALAGDTLAGRFDILELVGVGGMGAVYRARDRELDEVVALKVIKRSLAAIPAVVERFRQEVKLARRVTHVNVARTYELGTSDGVMYCTMELIEGESLTKRLSQRGKLPVADAVSIVCALCDGLATAHAADVMHRDIKPDNILIANDGRVVLADFGVAAIGHAAGELSGTPAYMAPEQARGETATPSSDVYAVGIVLYEMLSGRHPFHGSPAEVLSAKQTIEHVQLVDPPELATVIARATAREPGQRLATAAALRAALEPWAKPSSSIGAPMRATATDAEVATVIVLAPVGKVDEPKLYLAEAVHEELLARLSKLPRVRVLPRTAAGAEEDAIIVRIVRGEVLHVEIRHPHGPPARIELPLETAQVAADADAIAAAVECALREHAYDPSEAYDLLLRARHLAHHDVTRMPDALAALARAHEIAPDDARVTANLAIAQLRYAFFSGSPETMRGAVDLARKNVVAHPDLADAQLAAGNAELALGDPVAAARHFRTAIRCAPHLADAHEQLGRMLIEAGYDAPGIARLDEAIAIAPNLHFARWEIARSLAVAGRWEAYDRLEAELVASGVDRPLSRARYAWWRRDWNKLETFRASVTTMDRALWPGLLNLVLSVFLEGTWARDREALVAASTATMGGSKRRCSFICQLVAECAAFSGDIETAMMLMIRASDHGLYDLPWLDRCSLLDPVRAHAQFAPLRALIKGRADAILDALYGDNVALSATQIA